MMSAFGVCNFKAALLMHSDALYHQLMLVPLNAAVWV